MSLITPPPNLLGVSVPHPGLLPTSIDNFLINGDAGWRVNIGDALTDLSIDFNIDGTSTVIAQIEDPHRELLRSQMGLQRSVITIDGINFVMAEIDKSGPQITLTFEHAVCSRLKDHIETISVPANTMPRTSFCQKLVAYEGWIQCLLPGGPSPGNAITRLSTGNVDSSTGGALPLPYSTTFQEPETFWDSTGTILDTIGWRRFPLGKNGLMMVSDQWLYNQVPITTVDEDTDGVDNIDFNYDIRKPLGSLTINCRAAMWAFPVGSVVAIGHNMGIVGIQAAASTQERETIPGQLPPIGGHWLVTDISRSLMSASATITLDVPELTMTEPQTEPPTSLPAEVASGIDAALANQSDLLSIRGGATTGANATSRVAAFVAFAKSKVGGPYLWGGSGPTAYDCSGLVQAAAASIGVSLPHNSQLIYGACMSAHTACTVETAISTYGALLVRAAGTLGPSDGGHIAISLGNGQTVEAADVAVGIIIGNDATTTNFNLAGLLPGVKY
jgi:NlpC/P60 family protein